MILHPSRLYFKPKIIYLFLVFLIYCTCNRDENSYDPCSRIYNTENISPALSSRVWIPYSDNQNLVFQNSSGDSIILSTALVNKSIEGNLSHFMIICPQDSTKKSTVNYSTQIYYTKLNNVSQHSALLSINIYLDVLIDEKKSTLEDIQMADVLKIEFNIKSNTQQSVNIPIIQFPVFERGYKNALNSTYTFLSQKKLGPYTFSDVFLNLENSEQLNLYYSDLGLLAIEIQNELYVIKK